MTQLNSPKTMALLKANARLHRVRGAVRAHAASSFLEGGKSHSAVSNEELEEWQESNMAPLSLVTADHSDSLTAHINEKSYSDTIVAFTEHCGSRYVGHPGNRLAADYIKNKFSAAGFTVKEEGFSFDMPGSLLQTQLSSTAKSLPSLIELVSAQAGNVVAFKKGTDLDGEVVLMGAHYDSVNWRHFGEGAHQEAPGVDDNASGIAALLLMAEAMQKHQPRRSVLLVAFNAEELGLLGSKAFAKNSIKKYGDIKAAIICDEIAFAGRMQFDHKAIFETLGRSDGTAAILDTMAHHSADRHPEGGVAHFEVNYHGFGSDHIPFLEAGVPAVLLIERDDEWKADYTGHSEDDTIESLSMDFGAKMTRLAVRSIMHLANPAQ